jgi:hypothetical protein
MSLLLNNRATGRTAILGSLLTISCFLYGAEPACAQARDQFKLLSTRRFEIRFDADSAKARSIGELAETVYDDVNRWATDLSLPVKQVIGSMRVELHADWDKYAAMAGRHGFVVNEMLPGFFDQQANRCITFDYANSKLIRQKRAEIEDALRRAKEDAIANSPEVDRATKAEAELAAHEEMINQTVLRHEIAHQVLFNLGLEMGGPSRRRWLAEGLAMQFETWRPPNVYRLDDFLEAGKRADPISVRTLLTSPACIGPGAERLQDGYATAWALVHYLRERYPKELSGYLRKTFATSSPSDERGELARFEEAFGALNVEFEYRFRAHFAKAGNATSAPAGADGE